MRQNDWPELRPALENNDLLVIQGMAEVLPGALPILVSGEAPVALLGDIVAGQLIATNDFLLEKGVAPLFVATVNETIRMVRFDKRAWDGVPPEIFAEEATRMNLGLWTTDYRNFHQGLLNVNKHTGSYMRNRGERTEFEQLYINGALIFNKVFTADIPPHAFFCHFTFETTELANLSEKQRKEAEAVHRPEFVRLTNQEIVFLAGLS